VYVVVKKCTYKPWKRMLDVWIENFCVFLYYWALSERKKVIGLLLPAIEPDDRF